MPIPFITTPAEVLLSLGKWLLEKSTGAITASVIIGAVVWALEEFWCVILWQSINISIAFSNWMEDQIPEPLTLALDGVSSWLPYLNYWVPIGEFFTLLGIYWTFCFLLIAYRVIKSWVPSVSG